MEPQVPELGRPVGWKLQETAFPSREELCGACIGERCTASLPPWGLLCKQRLYFTLERSLGRTLRPLNLLF